MRKRDILETNKLKLFHVSEEPNIEVFIPRLPSRNDMDKSKGLVWAVSEKCLPNYLVPRDCPRVTYYVTEDTTNEDQLRFFTTTLNHCVAIEKKWWERMKNTTLYLYEFNISNFKMQDECAGYFVSEQIERPISIIKISDLFNELFNRKVELKICDNLWALANGVKSSTLNFSLIRMNNVIVQSQVECEAEH